MTRKEILTSDKDMLTPYDIAPILRANPATLRMTARDFPERVKFPFMFSGNRMKIPRIGFIAWMGWKEEGNG